MVNFFAAHYICLGVWYVLLYLVWIVCLLTNGSFRMASILVNWVVLFLMFKNLATGLDGFNHTVPEGKDRTQRERATVVRSALSLYGTLLRKLYLQKKGHIFVSFSLLPDA